MAMGLALLAAPLAPVLDGHWLVGFYHIGDLQLRVDLEEHMKRVNCYLNQGLECASTCTTNTVILIYFYPPTLKQPQAIQGNKMQMTA